MLQRSQSILPIFHPPSWSCFPTIGNSKARFDTFKDSKPCDVYMIGTKKIHIFGRELESSDFILGNPSISRHHAAIVHDEKGGIYIIDLMSRHGTFIGRKKLAPHDPELLHEGDIVRFGQSRRIYILRGIDPNSLSAPIKKTLLRMNMNIKPPILKSLFRKTNLNYTKKKKVHQPDIIKLINEICHVSTTSLPSTITDNTTSSLNSAMSSVRVDNNNTNTSRGVVMTALPCTTVSTQSVVSFTDEESEKFEKFVTNVSKMDVDNQRSIAELLLEKVTLRFSLKAMTVHRNAWHLIYLLISNYVAVEHFEDNFSIISRLSQSKSDSYGRKEARKILHLLAAVRVDPDNEEKVYDPNNIDTSNRTINNDQASNNEGDTIPPIEIKIQNNTDKIPETHLASKSVHTPVIFPKDFKKKSKNESHDSETPLDNITHSEMTRQRRLSDEGKRIFLESHDSTNTYIDTSNENNNGYEHDNDKNMSDDIDGCELESDRDSTSWSPKSTGTPKKYVNSSNDRENLSSSAFNFITNIEPTPRRRQDDQNLIFINFLNDKPSLDPNDFENLWKQTKTSEEWTCELIETVEDNFMEKMFLKLNLFCLANGKIDNLQKFFFHAEQKSNGTIFMVEMNIIGNLITITVKWHEMTLIYDNGHTTFIQSLKNILSPLCTSDDIDDEIEIVLNENTYIDPGTFENVWQEAVEAGDILFYLNTFLSNEEIEDILCENHIFCMASGMINDQQTKFFFFAETVEKLLLFLIEMIYDNKLKKIEAVIKIREIKNNNSETYMRYENYVNYIKRIITNSFLDYIK